MFGQIAFSLGLLAATLPAGGCFLDTCENTLVRSLPSPDGRQQAVLFERSCGTTTGFSTQVSILAIGAKPKGPGNVFSADDDHGQAVAGPWGGVWAEMNWESSRRLRIGHAPGARLIKATARHGQTTIVYAPVDVSAPSP